MGPGVFKHVYPDGRVVFNESPYPPAPTTSESQAERDELQRRFDDERRAQNPAARAATLERSKSFAEDFADRKAARADSLSWLNQESPVLGPINDAATDLAIDVGRDHPILGCILQVGRWSFFRDGSNADLLLMAAGPLGRAEGKAALTAEERLAMRAEVAEARAGTVGIGNAEAGTANKLWSDTPGVRTGRRTGIPSAADPETVRSLTRENESADLLVKNGFNVEQNPTVLGAKKPDYRINGEIFDNYAPATGNGRNIWSYVQDKVEAGQAPNVVINLADSPANVGDLMQQFGKHQIPNLQRVIFIDQNGDVSVHLHYKRNGG